LIVSITESTIIFVPRVQAEDQHDANPVNVTTTNSGKDTQIQGAEDKAKSEAKDTKEDKPRSQDVSKANTVPAVSHVPIHRPVVQPLGTPKEKGLTERMLSSQLSKNISRTQEDCNEQDGGRDEACEDISRER
jgi:hypothetical protein